MRNKKGFTLIEMVVVIVVLAIIASFAIPAIMGSIKEYQNEKYIIDARKVYTDVQLFIIRKKVYFGVETPNDKIKYYDCTTKRIENREFKDAIVGLYTCEDSVSSYENSNSVITVDVNDGFKVISFSTYYKFYENTKEVAFDELGTPKVSDEYN